MHKTVHHFLLEAEGGELSDEDVEVAEVAWIPFADLGARLGYPDERRLLDRIPEVIGSPSVGSPSVGAPSVGSPPSEAACPAPPA